LVREKKGMKWKKAGKMSLFDIESIVYVVFLPSRAHRRDCQMYASGSFNGLCSLTNGPLTLKCSLSWTQNYLSSGLKKFGGRLKSETH
jgi:hypothetical protein